MNTTVGKRRGRPSRMPKGVQRPVYLHQWQKSALDERFRVHTTRFFDELRDAAGEDWISQVTMNDLWCRRHAWRLNYLGKWYAERENLVDRSELEVIRPLVSEDKIVLKADYAAEVDETETILKLQNTVLGDHAESPDSFMTSRGLLERWVLVYVSIWLLGKHGISPKNYWGTKILYYCGFKHNLAESIKADYGSYEFPGLLRLRKPIIPGPFLIDAKHEFLGGWERDVAKARRYLAGKLCESDLADSVAAIKRSLNTKG